jgi:hypothetical protein
MELKRGSLIRHKITHEVGILLDIKVWNKRGYDLTRKLTNKIFSSRYFPSIFKNKESSNIDFYIHWANGHKSWIISSGVILIKEATS